MCWRDLERAVQILMSANVNELKQCCKEWAKILPQPRTDMKSYRRPLGVVVAEQGPTSCWTWCFTPLISSWLHFCLINVEMVESTVLNFICSLGSELKYFRTTTLWRCFDTRTDVDFRTENVFFFFIYEQNVLKKKRSSSELITRRDVTVDHVRSKKHSQN